MTFPALSDRATAPSGTTSNQTDCQLSLYTEWRSPQTGNGASLADHLRNLALKP